MEFHETTIQRNSLDNEYSSTDMTINISFFEGQENWNLFDCTSAVMYRTTSSYSKRQIWVTVLKKIQEKNSNSNNETISSHGFSSSSFLYYNADSKNSDYFSTQPSIVKLPPVSSGIEKVCNNCGNKLSFISNRVCSLCERVFCKNCCNEKVFIQGSFIQLYL